MAAVTSLIDRCGLDPETAAALRVHLDWVHYQRSFRDPVLVRRQRGSAGDRTRAAR
jgi:hypothetical protein